MFLLKSYDTDEIWHISKYLFEHTLIILFLCIYFDYTLKTYLFVCFFDYTRGIFYLSLNLVDLNGSRPFFNLKVS